jgi:hypothetical protein
MDALISNLTVEARLIGRAKQNIPQWQIPLPPELQNPSHTLRDLIAQVVREEVTAFQCRQKERQITQVLTQIELEQALLRGKIISGGQDLSQAVDEEVAVATALQAFEDGLYLIFLDDQQQTDLDESVILHSHSHLTFIRLVALAGG